MFSDWNELFSIPRRRLAERGASYTCMHWEWWSRCIPCGFSTCLWRSMDMEPWLLRTSMSARICWERHWWPALPRCWTYLQTPSGSSLKVRDPRDPRDPKYSRDPGDGMVDESVRSWSRLSPEGIHHESPCFSEAFWVADESISSLEGQDMGTIRLLRYPPAETPEEAARRQVASYGISPHTDFEAGSNHHGKWGLNQETWPLVKWAGFMG